MLGVDFAGPIKYRDKGKKEKKSYLVMFACSLTRAVHLELVRDGGIYNLLKEVYCEKRKTRTSLLRSRVHIQGCGKVVVKGPETRNV